MMDRPRYRRVGHAVEKEEWLPPERCGLLRVLAVRAVG
jgi:hypothetical protein